MACFSLLGGMKAEKQATKNGMNGLVLFLRTATRDFSKRVNKFILKLSKFFMRLFARFSYDSTSFTSVCTYINFT